MTTTHPSTQTHSAPGSLANLFDGKNFRGIDTEAEIAVLRDKNLPDAPLLKVLDNGVVFVGLTNQTSSLNPCEISYRGGYLTGIDTTNQKTLFNIAIDKADHDVIAQAMRKDAVVVCEASERGMLVYSQVQIKA